MRRFVIFVLGLCFATPLAARIPAPGTTERRAILDALRPSVESQLGPRVEFVVERLNVERGWAFVQAKPQRKGGRSINWRQHFHPSEWEMMDGLTVTALLEFRGKRWNLIDKAIGATDAWYCGRAQFRRVTHC